MHLLVQFEGNMSRWDGFQNPVPTLDKNFRVANGQINPVFSRLTVQQPRAAAHYHGLSINVRRRLATGLQFQSAFSLSKNLDNAPHPSMPRAVWRKASGPFTTGTSQ